MVTITKLTAVVVAGDDVVFDLTLKKDGVVDPDFLVGAVCTASIGPGGSATSNILEDLPVVITDAANGLASLQLSKAQTLLLTPTSEIRPEKSVIQYCDVKVIESGGNQTHNGPFSFPVRGAIT